MSDLAAAGFTRGQIRAALDAGTLTRIRRGVVAVSQDPLAAVQGERREADRAEHRAAAAGAVKTFGAGAVVSHQSAAVFVGMPSMRPHERLTRVSLTTPTGRRLRTGIRTYEGTVDLRDQVLVDGVPCTSIARTALDLARERPLREALVVLDWALSRVPLDELESAYSRMPSRHGMAGLARAITAADPRSESPLESASRGAMIEAGLPLPDLQTWIRDDEGHRYRVDFHWLEQQIIGEADGWRKYADAAALRSEKRREDALRRLGYGFVRWTSDEVWPRPDPMLARLRRALS